MMILTTFFGGIYRIIKYVHLIQVSKYCEKISFGFSVTFEIHVLTVRFGKYSTGVIPVPTSPRQMGLKAW